MQIEVDVVLEMRIDVAELIGRGSCQLLRLYAEQR